MPEDSIMVELAKFRCLVRGLMQKFCPTGVVTLENFLYDGTPRYTGEIGWQTVGDDVILYYKEEEEEEDEIS
jgi:hypothetical protein